jgi:hypothetical protein
VTAAVALSSATGVIVSPNGRAAAATAVLAGLLAAPGIWAPLSGSTYDGGITASAGTFLLHGLVPYRDFWLLYGPLTGIVAALLGFVFGNTIEVLRIAGLALVVLTGLIGFGLVGDRLPSIPRSAIAIVAALIPVYHVGLDLAPWALAMALSLGAIVLVRRTEPRALMLAGVLLGLAMLARQDLGAYAIVAVVIATRSLRPAVGAALVVVPVAIVLVAVVPLDALIEQLIWYPLVGPRLFRGLPAPALTGLLDPGTTINWLLYWPPLLLIGLAVVRWVRTGSIPRTDLAILVLALLCRLQTLGRADLDHDAQAAVPAILLAGYVFAGSASRAGRLALAFGTSAFLLLAALPLVWLVSPPDPYDVALTEAVANVQARTTWDEPIFAGEIRNRHALLNPLLAYYLADRPSGVRDTMYNPGVTTTERTQQRMVDDLRSARVRYLILDVRWADCYETSNLSAEPGATVLDAAIRQDYRVMADYGAIVIMGPRGGPFDIVAPTAWADPAPPPDHDPFVCERSARQP